MNWFEDSEQKRNLLVGGLIIICLAILAVSARRNNVSFDSYWHLQAGLDWINHGLSPWRDHFSFTFNGEAITGPPYLFEALLAWLAESMGVEIGFQVYVITNFVAVLGLVVIFLRMVRAPVVLYGLVLPLVAVLLQLRAMARPELISYSFCVIAIILYYRAKSVLSASTVMPMVALMFIWSNYHSSIFGYIIFFGFFLDVALGQIRNNSTTAAWAKWLGWGIAIVAVGFITPDRSHALINLLTFSPEWKDLIQEYQSPTLYKGIAAIYALIVIAAFTLPLVLIKKRVGLFVVSLILIFYSLQMARLVTPNGIILLCIFSWVATEIDIRAQLASRTATFNRTVGAVVLLLVILSLSSGVRLARDYMAENRTSEAIFPYDVVDYMLSNEISGRVFNEYDAGGYLVHRLSPDIQIYLDGRTNILYPLDHYHRYVEARKSPEALKAEIEKYDIPMVILRTDPRVFTLAQDTGVLGLDYLGESFVLYRRENPNFPVLGRLLAKPACWEQGMISALQNEQSAALWHLPSNSPLLPLLDVVIRYANSEDPGYFLENLDKAGPWNDFNLRFMGFQALNYNLDVVAYELFAGIGTKRFQDYLGAAWAKSRLLEWRAAEELLDSATRVPWPNSKPSDLLILIGILERIQKHDQLELIEPAYLEDLYTQSGQFFDSGTDHALEFKSFCPGVKVLE